jgi:hypothetical protein
MSVEDGEPYLHWLILGQAEPFDVWVKIHLPWALADSIYNDEPAGQITPEQVLESLPGERAVFALQDDAGTNIVGGVTNPGGEDALRVLLHEFIGIIVASTSPSTRETTALAQRRIQDIIDVA